MPRVVINGCYGGFSLSSEAEDLFLRYSQREFVTPLYTSDAMRADPHLLRVVEELGLSANVNYSFLRIIEVPDDVDWIICENDGWEWVAEKHRTWGHEV